MTKNKINYLLPILIIVVFASLILITSGLNYVRVGTTGYGANNTNVTENVNQTAHLNISITGGKNG